MKAKIFTKGDVSQIFLSNGENFRSKQKEKRAQLLDRVTKYVQDDLVEEFELKEMTLKGMKALTSKAILKTYPNAEGLFQEFLGDVLTARGIELPVVAVVEKKSKVKKAAAKKSAPKKVAKDPTERQNALAAFKETATYKSAKKHIGKTVKYKNRGNDKTKTGVVKGILINRAANVAYFMVLDNKTGKRDSCILDNLQFQD